MIYIIWTTSGPLFGSLKNSTTKWININLPVYYTDAPKMSSKESAARAAVQTDQHFLGEVIRLVLNGNGVSFWKSNKIRKLLEVCEIFSGYMSVEQHFYLAQSESNRNFVVSRLNRNLDRCRRGECLDDVVSASG